MHNISNVDVHSVRPFDATINVFVYPNNNNNKYNVIEFGTYRCEKNGLLVGEASKQNVISESNAGACVRWCARKIKTHGIASVCFTAEKRIKY